MLPDEEVDSFQWKMYDNVPTTFGKNPVLQIMAILGNRILNIFVYSKTILLASLSKFQTDY